MSDDWKRQPAALRDATGAFCKTVLDSIIGPVREVSRNLGYAVAVHGSLARDIDLVAVPWTDQRVPPDKLAEAICGAVAGVLGWCRTDGQVGEKPHGRRAYTLIHAGHVGEIDLSVFSPADDTGESHADQ